MHSSLDRPESRHIAALSGVVETPQHSRVCLGCHATAADAGPRWTTASFDVRDGVQCEACHGAGSLHAAALRNPDSDRVREDDPDLAAGAEAGPSLVFIHGTGTDAGVFFQQMEALKGERRVVSVYLPAISNTDELASVVG